MADYMFVYILFHSFFILVSILHVKTEFKLTLIESLNYPIEAPHNEFVKQILQPMEMQKYQGTKKIFKNFGE